MQEELQKLRQIISSKDHTMLMNFLKELITGYQSGSIQ
jgi:hypothetical protein